MALQALAARYKLRCALRETDLEYHDRLVLNAGARQRRSGKSRLETHALGPLQPIHKRADNRLASRLLASWIRDSILNEALTVREEKKLRAYRLPFLGEHLSVGKGRVASATQNTARRNLSGFLGNNLRPAPPSQHLSLAVQKVSAERMVRRTLGDGINEDRHGNPFRRVIVANSNVLPLRVILRNLVAFEAAEARRETKLGWCIGVGLGAARLRLCSATVPVGAARDTAQTNKSEERQRGKPHKEWFRR